MKTLPQIYVAGLFHKTKHGKCVAVVPEQESIATHMQRQSIRMENCYNGSSKRVEVKPNLKAKY